MSVSAAPRRILFVQRPAGGGSAVTLHELVAHMDRDAFTPVVVVHEQSDFVDRFRDAGARVLLLAEQGSASTQARRRARGAGAALKIVRRLAPGVTSVESQEARRFRRVIMDERIDLVHHNNNLRGNRASIMAAAALRRAQVCHVRMLRSYSPWTDRRLARRVDAFIYVSTAVERECRERLGVPMQRGSVIHCPVDTRRFTLGGATAVRRDLGIPDGVPLISNVGRIVWWKGQHHFLRAMTTVMRQFPDARALIVGAPADRHDRRAYHDRLMRLAAELGIADRVVFTGQRNDVPDIMAASDVIVHSACRPEPLGLVVLEAMAAARPVVATGAGGVLDVVREGVHGHLVPLADPAAMAAAISGLLEQPERARAMGRSGRAHVERAFGPTRYARAIEDVYTRVLGSYS